MVYIKPKQQKTRELELLHSFKDSGFFDKYIDKNNCLFILKT